MGFFLNPHFGAVILTTPFFEPRRPRGSFFSSVRVTPKTYGFNFWGRTGRGVSHTPSPTTPPRRRTPVLGYADRHSKATAREQQFINHGWGPYPHLPPPPFLVLTQEKEAKESQGYGCQAERRAADAEIRKTCVATLRFEHSDFRARPCNSSFRALVPLMPFFGRVKGRGKPSPIIRQPPGPCRARFRGVFNTPLP